MYIVFIKADEDGGIIGTLLEIDGYFGNAFAVKQSLEVMFFEAFAVHGTGFGKNGICRL